MAENSSIEWTDHTWSPWEGCTKVSPGCDHCYAESMNRWLRKGANWGPGAPRRTYSDAHWDKPRRWNDAACKAGTHPKVFPSVCDPFDNAAPEGERERFFDLIEATPHLTWLLLTKRIGNVKDMLPWRWAGALPRNVWLGATIVNQEEADRDIPKLLATPARLHFLSIEPMLGPISLRRFMGQGFGPAPMWVIVGGESGPGARPMHPDWARSLRDQCEAVGVPFLFKQHGEWLATAFCTDEQADQPHRGLAYVARDGQWHDGSRGVDFFGGEQETARVGKKAAGRLLDGVTHDGFPEVA